MDAFDREIQALEEALFHGDITDTEYDRDVESLESDYRDQAQRAAQDDEMARW